MSSSLWTVFSSCALQPFALVSELLFDTLASLSFGLSDFNPLKPS
jgi:hypothetical protein